MPEFQCSLDIGTPEWWDKVEWFWGFPQTLKKRFPVSKDKRRPNKSTKEPFHLFFGGPTCVEVFYYCFAVFGHSLCIHIDDSPDGTNPDAQVFDCPGGVNSFRLILEYSEFIQKGVEIFGIFFSSCFGCVHALEVIQKV